ncbi:GTPase, G3E family [Oscillospiraceae bacterium]|nr:GTPase, G3E family [Oscillospiraceae bacterium]
MKILVISGFLGAGKTTFIKEMIRKSGIRPVILENEYGQTDLDSKELSGSSSSVEVMEFMEGCVCCSQKDTFANSLISISASLDPEYLVVEPTGVGKLGNILMNIKKVEWEKISLLKPVVILAPRTYYSNMAEYGSICENQIKNASYIVFSKIENEDRDYIAKIKEEVQKINPDAKILDTDYHRADPEWFKTLLTGESADNIVEDPEDMFSDLDMYTLKRVEMTSPSVLIQMLDMAVRGQLGDIARIKGIVKCGDTWLRFDAADGLYSITGVQEEAPETQCVFIGNTIDRTKIDSLFVHTGLRRKNNITSQGLPISSPVLLKK